MHVHVHTCMHVRVCTLTCNSVNACSCTYMFVSCTDVFVPFCQILSRCKGSQMRASLSNVATSMAKPDGAAGGAGPQPPERSWLHHDWKEKLSLIQAGELCPFWASVTSSDAALQAQGRSPLPAGIRSQPVTTHRPISNSWGDDEFRIHGLV